MAGGSGGRREVEEDAPDPSRWAGVRYVVGVVVYAVAGGFLLKLMGF